MIVSPCISICKTDPVTGYCYGCGRSNDDKKMWKDEKTTNEWKKNNLLEIERRLKLFSEEQSLGLGKVITPIRLAICGTLNGPAVFDILELIGKETTIKRINTALESLPK